MSIFPELLQIVESSAPEIAGALGGPLAGVAMTLVANAFGVKTKDPASILSAIQADPNAAMKLQELNLHHSEELANIYSEKYKTEVDDRKNAREREIELKDDTPAILAYILTIGVFSSLFYLFYSEVPTNNKELIVSIVSALTTVWVAAMAYYHGSSIGSKNKEKMLNNNK